MSVTLSLSVQTAALCANAAGIVYDFRAHESVVSALANFTSVVLTEVSVTAWQTYTPDPNAKAKYLPWVFRLGIAPRGMVVTSVAEIPHLLTFTSQPNSIASYSGTLPLPVGIQYDLRSAEVVSNWPQFYIGHNNPADADTGTIARAQLTFSVVCSGTGYGMPVA
jgi:hypothetical protein